jgi:hypothetical protein|tara:strand:+ start:116 stop:241 length:126 start_codon:yes stop_codon:yes gene_type:complete
MRKITIGNKVEIFVSTGGNLCCIRAQNGWRGDNIAETMAGN